jgi:putative NADH-flavin reductase
VNLLVFGASGGTGRHIVTQALARGVDVTAFVRRGNSLALQRGLEIVEGDVGNAAAVATAIAARDVVISALGVGTPLKADPVVRAGVDHIVQAMEAGPTRRLIYLSFIGVTASRTAAGPLIRYVARFPLRHEIADHEQKERRIQTSALQWTIVRAPKLTDGPQTGSYCVGEAIVATSFFPRLSRADVAEFLVNEALEPRFTQATVRLLPAATSPGVAAADRG